MLTESQNFTRKQVEDPHFIWQERHFDGIQLINICKRSYITHQDNYVTDDGRKRVLSIVLLLLAKTIIVFALLLGYLSWV